MLMSQWLKKCRKTHASREDTTSSLRASPPEEYHLADPPLHSQRWESGVCGGGCFNLIFNNLLY